MVSFFYGFAISVMTAIVIVIFSISVQLQNVTKLLQEIKGILEVPGK